MMHKLLNALLMVVTLGVGVADVHAQSDGSTRKAREAYARAQRLFREADYEAAQDAFEQAYRHVPNPVVLLGIAESQQRLGRWADAEETLTRYLQERPDAPDRAQVEQQLAEIRKRPAVVEIDSTPPGAVILVDGTDTGMVTPASVELEAGEHLVVLRSPEGVEREQTLTTVPGGAQTLQLELVEALPEPAVVELEPEPVPAEDFASHAADDERARRVRNAAWASVGVAGAGLVMGTVLGGLALKERNDFDDRPTNAKADRGEKLAIFADLGFGIAIAGAVTAVVLFTTGDKGDDTRPEQARLQVWPALGKGSGGLGASLAF